MLPELTILSREGLETSHGFTNFGTIVTSIERVAKSKIGEARFWVRGLAISPPKFSHFWERVFPLELSEKKTGRNSWAGPPTFNHHWRGIVRAQNLEVIDAEDRFWAMNVANNVSLVQVLFGQFHRMDVTGWFIFIDVEESSSHDYDNGHEDNENTDNKSLNEGPGDDCEERSAADNIIDDA
jgi:hypothetical protein